MKQKKDKSSVDRRRFLKQSAAITATGLIGNAVFNGFADYSGSAASTAFAQQNTNFTPTGGEVPVDHLTGYIVDDHQAWFRLNNTALTSYRAHTTQKYPYFYPVAGPKTGLSLTSETGLPWPHHRSLLFGWDRVNGGNYWQDVLEKGQIVSQGIRLGKIDATTAELFDHCLWKRPGQEPIIDDTREFTLKVQPNGNYIIDCRFRLKMLTDVTFEKTNHGLFAVRCAQDLCPNSGGVLLNSEGQSGEAETFGKPARWCTFYGKRANVQGEVVEGIAMLLHKDVPHPAFENCPWFTRDYGNYSPMPMNWFSEPLKLAADDELDLKYRVVAYAGLPKDADLDGLWEEFNQKS